MQAILIAPNWTKQSWSELLRQITIKKKILGAAETVLTKGKKMNKIHAELPPGDIAAFLLDTRTIRETSSSPPT
jgi:hypothetical protein